MNVNSCITFELHDDMCQFIIGCIYLNGVTCMHVSAGIVFAINDSFVNIFLHSNIYIYM